MELLLLSLHVTAVIRTLGSRGDVGQVWRRSWVLSRVGAEAGASSGFRGNSDIWSSGLSDGPQSMGPWQARIEGGHGRWGRLLAGSLVSGPLPRLLQGTSSRACLLPSCCPGRRVERARGQDMWGTWSLVLPDLQTEVLRKWDSRGL